jgi:hypothetical protein
MRYLDFILICIKLLPEIVMFVFDIVVAINKTRKVVKDQRIRTRKRKLEYKRRRKDFIHK